MKKIVSQKYQLKYDYFITEEGQVYSSKTNKILKQHLDKDGYCKVRLVCTDNRHTFSVHRLVLETFNPIDNMGNFQVNHIDGNKLNNNINNLEWCNCSENIKHAYKTGLKTQKGSNNNASKLNEEQVVKIIELLKEKELTQKQIGEKFNVSAECIGAIKRKENWKELTKGINFD